MGLNRLLLAPALLAGQPWASYAVWTLYFLGQAMICVGVVTPLSRGQRTLVYR